MATLQVAPTRHSQTELISGILTNLYLPSPKIKGEGGRVGKKQHKNGKQATRLKQRHFAKNCKQATMYVSHEVPPLEASRLPSAVGKTADHLFEVNFS